MPKAINIIFDGPPGPEGGRFVDVVTDDGKEIKIGEWIHDTKDNLWRLRIKELPSGGTGIPAHVIKAAKETWPNVDVAALECECVDCDQKETCPYAFDLYNIYTTDGHIIDTGPLCLK